MNIQRIKHWLKHPSRFIPSVLVRFGKYIPDKHYLKLKFYGIFGQRLNLNNPQTFNEKLQWLKLYNRNPEFTIMVDKVNVKKWVADRIGEQYIIPTLGVWERAEDIDFDSLPDQFVLKTNHDSGAVIICKNKSKIDKTRILKSMSEYLSSNFFEIGREWPYKNVRRRILAEEFMVDESGYELKDYKIFCFSGKPEIIQVDFDRFSKSGHKRNLYTTDWSIIDCSYGYPSVPNHIIERPSNLDEMLKLASILSKNQTFIRVDFYSIKGSSKFGEITFYPGSGYEKFIPNEWDYKLGQLIKL